MDQIDGKCAPSSWWSNALKSAWSALTPNDNRIVCSGALEKLAVVSFYTDSERRISWVTRDGTEVASLASRPMLDQQVQGYDLTVRSVSAPNENVVTWHVHLPVAAGKSVVASGSKMPNIDAFLTSVLQRELVPSFWLQCESRSQLWFAEVSPSSAKKRRDRPFGDFAFVLVPLPWRQERQPAVTGACSVAQRTVADGNSGFADADGPLTAAAVACADLQRPLLLNSQ